VHRRDDEEAAVAAVGERRPGVLREQERAREQDCDQRVPAILVELRDRGDVLEAGVRDDCVETPETGERGLDDRAVPRTSRQVAVGEVHRVHVPAVADQPLRDRPADPAPGARHERRAAGHVTGPHRTTLAAQV
jgi:hypothetical protein